MDAFSDRALAILAIIACIFLLHWGAPFFIPLIVSIIIAFALSPVVDALTKLLRWRVLSATVVVAGVLALLAAITWSWRDDMERIWDQVPVAARAVADSVKKAARQPAGNVAEVTKAAAEIEAVAQTGKPAPAPAKPAPAPAAKPFWGMVWEGGAMVGTAIAQLVAVIFLVFFMLASGDLFKRKLVKIGGTTLSEKKMTVEVIDEIDRQIRRYLGVMAIANILVGVGTWAVFKMMGLNYPELWGMAAAIMHTAPYFGPAFIALGTLLAGFLQFGTWSHALAISGATIVVATLVGSVFQTWLASRESEMNTTATFVGLLFFGWIWGFWGLLIGIPLLAIVKTVCDHNEDWKGVAELLSR
ncbi:MAG TPA: AI-2E family transporter [Usitatibacter sp.]|nr:AI-2E family transporter [Usitatibacter sp.]